MNQTPSPISWEEEFDDAFGDYFRKKYDEVGYALFKSFISKTRSEAVLTALTELEERIKKDSQGKASILAMEGHINVPILWDKEEVLLFIKEAKDKAK